MLNNKNLKLISVIKKYINNDPELYIKFNHYNRKYTIDELLLYIIEILEDGISFRKIKSSISWSTIVKDKVKFYFTLLCSSLFEVMKVGLSPPPIYKFHQKLVQYKIIKNTYNINVNKYSSNLETLSQNNYLKNYT